MILESGMTALREEAFFVAFENDRRNLVRSIITILTGNIFLVRVWKMVKNYLLEKK